MRTILYPGSFDPVTVGHVQIALRARGLFDRVVVGVLHNPAKLGGALSVSQRLELLRDAFAGEEKIEIAAFSGLLVEAARACGACAVLRGVRSEADAAVELQMARVNRYYPASRRFFWHRRLKRLPSLPALRARWRALAGSLAGIVPQAVLEKAERYLAAR